jgi:hypothetical protein
MINPYSPPTAALERGFAEHRFRSVTPLALAIALFMALYAVAQAVSGVLSLVSIGEMRSAPAGGGLESGALVIELGAQAVRWFAIAIRLVAVVLFCVFMARANRNARAFGSPMSITPGWAAGYFFVPVLFLWKPYQAMKEIWQGSDPDPKAHAFSVRVPALLPWWWALYIAYYCAGIFATQVSRHVVSRRGLMMADWANVVRASVALVAALLAAKVVLAVARRQEQRHAAQPAG